ncbi:transcription factor MYB [Forsythia ovata]|uniref:Transcription factor MYB n=1 Tax=Forsythia ovata TaxID=205694 RepID=A0ABD1WVL3_9LAMI
MDKMTLDNGWAGPGLYSSQTQHYSIRLWRDLGRKCAAVAIDGDERPVQVLRRSNSVDVTTVVTNGFIVSPECLSPSNSEISDSIDHILANTNSNFYFPVIRNVVFPLPIQSSPAAMDDDNADDSLTTLTLSLPGSRNEFATLV